MLIIAFLSATLSLTSSAPVLLPAADFNMPTTSSPIIFGRELPDCVGVARYRTVQDIVLSCLATISACTWVAIHPNVPDPKDSRWLRLKQRVVTMIYAILAPEFIILWALRQRIGAARHMREYNENFYSSVTPPSGSIWRCIKDWFLGPKDEKQDELWTITHGFLLEMRGLVDSEGEVIEAVSLEYMYHANSPEALNIPEDDINDKSKGDFLTKLFVLLQTMWFIFQCLTRWIMHLPVTELEIVTLAFALLNIGTYALWWNKPQNMAVAIRMDRYQKPKTRQEKGKVIRGSGGDVTTIASSGARREASSLEEEKRNSEGAAARIFSANDRETFSEQEQEKSLDERKSPSGGGPAPNMDEGYHLLNSKSSLEDPPRQWPSFLVKIKVVARQCIHGVGILVTAVRTTFNPHCLQFLGFENAWELFLAPFRPLVGMAIESFDDDLPYERIFYCSTKTNREVSICFVVVGTLFGILHLVPIWSSSFPSSSAKLLWQISAGFITIAPLTTTLITFFFFEKEWWLLFLSDAIVFGSYLIARIILVILAFTTLRTLPPDAFRNITWTTFIPHF